MAFRLTIDGVDRTSLIRQTDTATITSPLNAQATAKFTCLPSLIPARFAEIVFYAQDGTTPIFGGVITNRSIRPLHDRATPSLADVDCADYGFYADCCYTNLTYAAAVQLETVVADLVTEKLGAYGITYTTAATGITLQPFTWTAMRASDALRDLCTKAATFGVSSLVFAFTPAKELRVFLAGSTAAPYSISDATPHCWDATWSDSDTIPSNTVLVNCGPSGVATQVQAWTADGTATSWVTDLPAAGLDPARVIVGGVSKEVGVGKAFTWDKPTHTLAVGTDPVPASGTAITLTYTALYPFIARASNVGTGVPVIEYLAPDAPDATTAGAGQDVADGILATVNQDPRVLTVTGADAGCEPGHALPIALTGRGVAGTFLISQVAIELVTAQTWHYTLTATEMQAVGAGFDAGGFDAGGFSTVADGVASTYQGSYLDQWRSLTGGGSSGASAATVDGLTPAVVVPTGGAAADVNTNVPTVDGQKITAASVTADKLVADLVLAQTLRSALAMALGTGVGFWIDASSNPPTFRVGDPAGAYMQWDGANLTTTGAKWNDGEVVFDNGSFMKASGTGFGTANQFVDWYGPSQASLDDCDEADAIYYLRVDGTAYFGGTLLLGQLSYSVKAATDLTVGNLADLGPNASNGKAIRVNFSYAFHARTAFAATTAGEAAYAAATKQAPSASLILSRSINGGAFADVMTLSITNGSHWEDAPAAGEEPGSYDQAMGGAGVYDDPALLAQPREYKLRIGSWTNVNATVTSNILTATSVEAL